MAMVRRNWPLAGLGSLCCIVILVLGLSSRPSYSLAQAPLPDTPAPSTDPGDPFPTPPELVGVNLLAQTEEQKQAKSVGCVHCHKNSHDPHFKDTVRIGCTDCHGGNAQTIDKNAAHICPKYPNAWTSTANPVRSYTLLNHESPEFVRFVNPGDFRVAHISCGTTNCHPSEVHTNKKSMMTHGCMLWNAALYNNGSVPSKKARFGESYAMNGAPLRMISNPPPTQYEVEHNKGVLPFLDPLPRYEVSQPGNILRIFERGGRFRPEVGIPEIREEPGRPRTRLSIRGLGTENRTDPVFVSLNKTRLFDPTLNFLGTNDHPGDYRSSGCTSCHVIYANDRSPIHSGPYAKFGHKGLSFDDDPTIPKNESGHPIQHRFTNAIPTSQCMVCHVHPGTNVMNSYIGYMWWDQETESKRMYPAKQKNPTPEELVRSMMSNPDETAARGLWNDPAFLEEIVRLNPQMSKAQFGDFHSHGWVFRAVFKKNVKGEYVDHRGEVVQDVNAAKLMAGMTFPLQAKEFHKQKFEHPKHAVEAEKKLDCMREGQPVHILDIHMEKGMHCVDCHFVQDMHGNGRIQQEVRAGTEIACIDCHGTTTKKTTLFTSGPAAYTSDKLDPAKGRNLSAMRTPFGKARFEREGERVFQNSMVEQGVRWEVVQTKDTITENHPRYNKLSHLSKTVRFEDGQMAWGDAPEELLHKKCAHSNDNMSCIACHSAWNPSCYGCHLPQKANLKMPQLHSEGISSRNYTSYNFQTLRDEVYMLGRDGDVTGNKIGPARSSCAIHVGSANNNRELIYSQQQTLSSPGYSGIAFSTNVPHTVRGKGETKLCTQCHISQANDNNAWMAQLLMHGTNYLNFMGKYCYVAAGEHGFAAITVTEQTEPQAVIGSSLHETSYPDNFRKHLEHHEELPHAGVHEHPGHDIGEKLKNPRRKHEVLSIQPRGEYAIAACGEDGVRAFDIAFIDDKAFSERITSAPVSPTGQFFHVETKYATSVIVPSTHAVDPTRKQFPENKEQPIHPLVGYIYATDKFEGLVFIGIGTMVDGNPLNNYLKKAFCFNPDGILNGATNGTILGTHLYVTCDAGLVVVDINDPTKPCVKSVVGAPFIKHPKAVQVQFRYAYVVDEEGIKVLETTDHASPKPRSMLRIPECHNIYLARTYAYVAGGPRGLIILDISKAEEPKIDQVYDAKGKINDLHDVKLSITYVSEFAYLADGKNGLQVVQLTSPETPGNEGFAPRPTPKLIAHFKIPYGGHALAVCEGLDRDRAVDEAGNQLSVFGRVGARPLNGAEQRRMYLNGGRIWQVTDNPDDPIYIKKPKR